jgi:hypothetical protein
MSDPNTTPDATKHCGILVPLPRPKTRHAADQAREMGLRVGDVIVGREGGGDPQTGWWSESRLRLLYLGKQCCVWKAEVSRKLHPEFRDEGEATNWTLAHRDWYLIKSIDGPTRHKDEWRQHECSECRLFWPTEKDADDCCND